MLKGKRYYKEIDALKGLAIFLVVLGHAIIYFPINLHDNKYCQFIYTMLSSVHMPLFFLIAGFCFSYHGNYKVFIRKKIYRLVIPYFVFNILDMIPRCVLPQLVNRPRGIMDSVLNILLFGGEYWFIYTLFIIFMIYPIIYKWQLASRYRKAVVSAISLLLATVGISIDILCLSSVAYFILFFNAGVLLKESRVPIFDIRYTKWNIPAFIGLIILWISLLSSHIAQYLNIPIAFVGIIACYLLTKIQLFNDTFERFGKFSLQIYLLNGFLLVISRTIVCKFTDIPGIIITFNIAVDFILSYAIIKSICNRIPICRALMGMN